MLKIDQKLMLQIPEIDSEHAELINRAEKVMNAYQDGDPQQEILKLLTFLQSYVVEHFNNEEALQLQWNYPNRIEHQQIHDQFKSDVGLLYEDIIEHGLTLNSRIKLNFLVREWITKHIGEEDKKIADFIHSKKQV